MGEKPAVEDQRGALVWGWPIHRHAVARIAGIEDYTLHICRCGATRGWVSGERRARRWGQ